MCMNIKIASVISEICIVLNRRLLLERDYSWPVTPDTVVSDNGPQFSSSDFAHFSKKGGFEHTPSSSHQSIKWES